MIQAAQAKRIKYAANRQEELAKPVNITASLNKNNNISDAQVSEAQKLVDESMSRWVLTYKKYVDNPRRNTYKFSTSRPSSRVQRSSDSPPAVDSTVAAAAALLAELDAAAKSKNGTLYTDYSKMEFNRETMSFGTTPRVVKRASSSYWMDLLSGDEHGTSPLAAAAGYKVRYLLITISLSPNCQLTKFLGLQKCQKRLWCQRGWTKC